MVGGESLRMGIADYNFACFGVAAPAGIYRTYKELMNSGDLKTYKDYTKTYAQACEPSLMRIQTYAQRIYEGNLAPYKDCLQHLT